MMLRTTILFLLLGTASLQLSAHALWIEAHPEGKSGKAHTVKVFYGEPSADTPDKNADWWSDVASFSLWLITPDGSKEQLTTTDQGDHLTATFTPSGDGVHSLSVSHMVEEISGGTRNQFNSTAMVTVGNGGE